MEIHLPVQRGYRHHYIYPDCIDSVAGMDGAFHAVKCVI